MKSDIQKLPKLSVHVLTVDIPSLNAYICVLPCEQSPSIFLDKSFLGESFPTHLGKIEATLLRTIVFFVDPHTDVCWQVKTPHLCFDISWCSQNFFDAVISLPSELTESWTASISWYRHNRISAYSADHGSTQTSSLRTQVRLNSLYSNDA